MQNTLTDEVLRAVTHVRRSDTVVKQKEDHETELTRLAETSVEKGVNEITGGEENRDQDFKVKKSDKINDANHRKNMARKKKKAQRQNRKKRR